MSIYLIANFGFDTAETEPCKICPHPVLLLLADADDSGAVEAPEVAALFAVRCRHFTEMLQA